MVESLVYAPSKIGRERSKTTPIRSLFFTPGLFVEFGKRDFAISRLDFFDASPALRIEKTFCFRPVRSGDAILLVRDGLASFVEQFDFYPVAGLGGGRTCRVV
jgi:hypothetical protein